MCSDFNLGERIWRKVRDAPLFGRKGNFHHLVTSDLKNLGINMTETEIQNQSKSSWKLFISKKIKEHVLTQLIEENSKSENTKDIVFSELKLGNYFQDNRNISISRIIFSVRSKTLDIKTWQHWKYFDNLCVLCEQKAEVMDHFMCCNAYENVTPIHSWKKMFENNPDEQFEIAENINKRQRQRNRKIEMLEACHLQIISDSKAPGDC